MGMKSSKIVLMGLTILLSIFTFNQLYNDYFIALYAEMVNFEVISDDYPIDQYFNVNTDKLSFDEFLDAADENDVVLEGMGNQVSKDGMILTYYLYGEKFDDVIDEFAITNSDHGSFANREDRRFYSSIEDAEATGSFFFPESYGDAIEMKSMFMMKEDGLGIGNNYIAYASNTENMERFKSQLNELSDGGVTYQGELEGGGALAGFEKDQKAFMQLMFFIVTLLFLMILTIMIFKKMRSVSIRKMHGFSSMKIINQEFGRLILLLIGMFSSVILIQFYVQIHALNHIALDFLVILFSLIAVFIGAFVLLYFLLVFYIHYMDMGKSIKNFDFTKTIMQINLGLKVILLVAILPSFIPMMKDFMESTTNRLTLSMNEERYESLYSFTVGPNERDVLSNQVMENLKIKLNELELIYQDFHDYEITQAVVERNELRTNFYPRANVNERYLSGYSIVDMSGQPIELESEVTILVPTSIYQTTFSKQNYKCGLACTYQEVQNFELFNLNVSNGYSPWVRNPVLYVHKNDSMKMEMDFDSFYIEESHGDEIEAFMSEFVKQSEFDLRCRQENIHNNILTIGLSNYVNTLFRILLYLVILFVMSYQFTQMYLETYQKEIAIKTSMGYGFLRKHQMILLMTALIYAGPMILIAFKNGFSIELFQYIFMICVFEELLLSLVLKLFDRKSTVQVLKGGN